MTDDDTLMTAWIQGDAHAFEQLYRRHQGPLYRFVRRVLGAALAMQVDEVFQDTWSRVIQVRERWSPQGASFRTWLFTLAHHRAIDCLRRSGRELSVDAVTSEEGRSATDSWAAWPAADGHNPSDTAYWRAAFVLHHDDGLSVDEMARVLELGFETAKSRLRYAMTKLRQCMGAYLGAEGLS